MTGIGSIGSAAVGSSGVQVSSNFSALMFPLSFPDIAPVSATFRLARVVASSASEFTLAQQVYRFVGSQWHGDVSFPPLSRTDAGILSAFLAALDGAYGTFLYGDPLALASGRMGAGGGAPLVDGGGQTGDTLHIKGCSANVAGWGKKGDYFQIGTGISARLYMLVQNVDTNGFGEATLNFKPELRLSPTDNEALQFDSPMGVMRLTGNVVEWAQDTDRLSRINFSFEEYIPQ